MVDDLRPPYRIQFDNARDPYTARNTLGIDSVLSGYATIADFPAGAWSIWTPTVTTGGGAITSTTINRARYIKLGKTVTAQVDITITDAGTGAGAFIFSLPVAILAGDVAAFGRETAVNGKQLTGNIVSTTTIGMAYYDNTSVIATNNRVLATVIYEVA